MNPPESPWGTTSTPYVEALSSGRSYKRWIAWLSVLVLIAGGLAWYFLIYKAPHALPVTITFATEPLSPGNTGVLRLTVRNDSPTEAALGARVVVVLPNKTTAQSQQEETEASVPNQPEISLGDIAPRGVAEVSFQLDTQLDPASAVPVTATISYATPRDSEQRFETTASTDLVIEQSAVSLVIDTPLSVTRDDAFNATISYRNNVDAAISGAVLAIVLPKGIELVSSTPVVSAGKINLPLLAKGQGGTLALRLRANASAAGNMALRASITSSRGLLAEQAASVGISKDALAVTVAVNGGDIANVSYAQTPNYLITVKNQSNTPLKDVVVSARFGGSLFEISSINAQGGVLSASQPVVTWNGIGAPGLRTIEPGGSVTLQASARVVRALTNAYQVSAPVSVTATSPTVPAGVSASGVVAHATATIRLAATATFDATAFWRDPLKQIANTGPQPPKVGVATQYAVRWSVGAAGADFKDLVVTANLAPGVRFTGKLGGTTSAALSYDARNGIVTWRPGIAKANASTQAAFQVEIIPGQNLVGRDVPLITSSNMTATDAFTGASLTESAGELSTTLRGAAATQGSGTVAP